MSEVVATVLALFEDGRQMELGEFRFVALPQSGDKLLTKPGAFVEDTWRVDHVRHEPASADADTPPRLNIVVRHEVQARYDPPVLPN
jgi:hypothetical protein